MSLFLVIILFSVEHLFQSEKCIPMISLQYERAIKICSPSSLDVSYSSDAIISLCHTTHFRVISTFNHFLRTKICFCIRKSKEKNKTVQSPAKKFH